VSIDGITNRIERHESFAAREYKNLRDGDRSAHYRVICKPEVKTNFRALSLSPMGAPHHKTAAINEGMLSAYLNTVAPSRAKITNSGGARWTGPETMGLINELRDSATDGSDTLPYFQHLG
jgi:hypothetical protein